MLKALPANSVEHNSEARILVKLNDLEARICGIEKTIGTLLQLAQFVTGGLMVIAFKYGFRKL